MQSDKRQEATEILQRYFKPKHRASELELHESEDDAKRLVHLICECVKEELIGPAFYGTKEIE